MKELRRVVAEVAKARPEPRRDGRRRCLRESLTRPHRRESSEQHPNPTGPPQSHGRARALFKHGGGPSFILSNNHRRDAAKLEVTGVYGCRSLSLTAHCPEIRPPCVASGDENT